ncbi:helicase/relaxase domain-containing protein [Erwinia mallotivora]|uniref:helicase/relaxase domain-containing protein n=1 Tax=Erwinia mallotivora TaxID=69222 RepID=UPI0021BE5EC2|nr:helicase/relaxase domain-containing protein [Erwinia mallotivora]
MFRRILTVITNRISANTSETPPVDSSTGFFSPLKGEQLTAIPIREKLLKRIRENSALPLPLYEKFQFEPLLSILEMTQNIPADKEGRWSNAGGFGDLTLTFTDIAIRMAQGYTFPPGAAPEEQSAQSLVWNAVLFWSALFYHLPLCYQLKGELESGIRWYPGLSIPEQPFRFRFQSFCSDRACSFAAMIAGRLLPSDAISWLAGTPLALQNVAFAIQNQHPEMMLLRTLLDEAAVIAESPLKQTSAHSNPAAPALQFQHPHPAFDDSSEHVPLPAESLIVADFTLASSSEGISGDNRENSFPESPSIVPSEQDVSKNTDTESLLSLFDDTGCDVSQSDEIVHESGILKETLNVNDVVPDGLDRTGKDEAQSDTKEKIFVTPDATDAGEFVRWLKEGVNSGELKFNQQTEKIHIIAGYVFLPVPDLFFSFLKSKSFDANSRESLQLSFEKLNIHKRHENRRFYYAVIYDDSEHKGKFRRAKGYLIKAKIIFPDKVPADSSFISIP